VIPPFNELGMLPAGIHDCTLMEVREVFGFNEHRVRLLAGLERFLEDKIRLRDGLNACPYFIDGSFTRNKAAPKDIDFVLDARALTEESVLQQLLFLRFGATSLKVDYDVDFWYLHPTLPNDVSMYFQYAGVSAAAELNIDAKTKKGILRITP
jgi:hypothetical protein